MSIPGANTITPSRFHVPPPPKRASQMVATSPPAIDVALQVILRERTRRPGHRATRTDRLRLRSRATASTRANRTSGARAVRPVIADAGEDQMVPVGRHGEWRHPKAANRKLTFSRRRDHETDSRVRLRGRRAALRRTIRPTAANASAATSSHATSSRRLTAHRRRGSRHGCRARARQLGEMIARAREISRQVARGPVAIRRPLGETPVDDPADRHRDRRIQFGRPAADRRE